MISSAHYQACRDRRLSDKACRAHGVLEHHLDYQEFRVVKLLWLAHLVPGDKGRPIARETAQRVLQQLVKLGYLARGAKVCEKKGQCYISYRLTTVANPVDPQVTPTAA